MNSRDKGKRGELELANLFKKMGYNTRRGQQYCGSNGDADVVGLPGIHIECKRNEHLNIYDAMAQAERDKVDYEKATVMWRKNNQRWLVTMYLEEWVELYEKGKVL